MGVRRRCFGCVEFFTFFSRLKEAGPGVSALLEGVVHDPLIAQGRGLLERNLGLDFGAGKCPLCRLLHVRTTSMSVYPVVLVGVSRSCSYSRRDTCEGGDICGFFRFLLGLVARRVRDVARCNKLAWAVSLVHMSRRVAKCSPWLFTLVSCGLNKKPCCVALFLVEERVT